jgi:hypothetical protein
MEVSRLEEKLVEVSDKLARRGQSLYLKEHEHEQTKPQQTAKDLSSAAKSQGNKFNM